MWPNPQETADLFKFSEEILYGKLFYAVIWNTNWNENAVNENLIFP